MNFLLEHKDIVLLIAGGIIGVVLPKAKAHLLGKKVGEKIPRKVAIMLADQIDAFEKGLRNENYRGDKNLISNEQLSEKTEKLKVNLGLGQ